MEFILIVLLVVVGILVFWIVQLSAQLPKKADETARILFDRWKTGELEAHRAQYQQHAQQQVQQQSQLLQQQAELHLREWKSSNEAAIRQDAITRSQAVIVGKVSEQIAPYSPVFPYNPKETRFIGSPIDLVVFDGLEEGHVRQVILMDVKTGNSSLSPKQKLIRDAVMAGRVAWQEFRL